MELKDILPALTEIHNNIADVYVKGDGAIRQGDAIKMCRDVIIAITKELNGDNAPTQENK